MSEERFKQIKDSIELQNLVKKQIGVEDELLQEEVELLKAYEKLKDNWKKLWDYLIDMDNRAYEKVYIDNVLEYMLELEKGSDNK